MVGRSPLTVLLHDAEKFHDDFRARPDHNLALACFFGIVDGLVVVSHLAGIPGEDSGAHTLSASLSTEVLTMMAGL